MPLSLMSFFTLARMASCCFLRSSACFCSSASRSFCSQKATASGQVHRSGDGDHKKTRSGLNGKIIPMYSNVRPQNWHVSGGGAGLSLSYPAAAASLALMVVLWLTFGSSVVGMEALEGVDVRRPGAPSWSSSPILCISCVLLSLL